MAIIFSTPKQRNQFNRIIIKCIPRDVTEENLTGWFDAGVTWVGMGSKLITKDIIENKSYSKLTQRVEKTLSLIKQIRSGK